MELMFGTDSAGLVLRLNGDESIRLMPDETGWGLWAPVHGEWVQVDSASSIDEALDLVLAPSTNGMAVAELDEVECLAVG